MKKICITTPEFPPEQWGGLARTAGKVAGHARDMGLDVHVAHLVVVSDRWVLLDENRETTEAGGITYHRIAVAKEKFATSERELWDCPHTLTLQMMYQSLEMLHRAEAFDLFHSFFLYPIGYVTGLLARRVKVPSIGTIVGNDVKKYGFSPEKAAVCRIGLENADRIAALSRDLMEMADAIAPVEHKTSIVYNSVDLPLRQWCRNREKEDPFRIGCAGIFKYAKGLPYLFKAAGALASRDVQLVLAGVVRSSEEHVLREMLFSSGMEKRTTWVGAVEHDRMPDWLQSLDVFVLPSLTEGCPNILMEAMAAGLPCVATRTGAVEELLEHDISGLLVPWGDSASLSSALAEIMHNPEKARAFGSAARKRMEAFSRDREFQSWISLYRELIEF
ncbi:MAG TPA: glycosyltransferase family 4 protein [Desulfomonilaceae bacterium]|nr:glycosyltransferase family 4 protein [Desulfomonilaceae bacterium]